MPYYQVSPVRRDSWKGIRKRFHVNPDYAAMYWVNRHWPELGRPDEVTVFVHEVDTDNTHEIQVYVGSELQAKRL